MLRHLTLALAIATPAAVAAQDAGGFADVVPAYDPEPTLSVGVGVSTMGITVTPEARLSDRLGIRLPVGYFSISESFDVEGNDIDGEATSAQGALLVDYYPTGGRFRLSFDIGAKFTKYGLSVDTSELEADANFDSTDIDQLIADFNNDAADYPVTPYAHFSVAVRF